MRQRLRLAVLAGAALAAAAQAPLAERPVLTLYEDAGSAANHGSWGNVIAAGDGAHVVIEPADRSRPATGETAVRLDFAFGPTPGSWAGLVVSSAPGYWGDERGPGFDLSGAARLVFAARGATGGERIRIKVAIAGDAPHGDSAPLPFDTGWLTLSTDWRDYELPVDGEALHRVVTPFVVIANRAHNPAGQATVYMDGIRFASAGVGRK